MRSCDIVGCEFLLGFRTCAAYLNLECPEVFHFHNLAGCQLHLHLANQSTEHVQHVTICQRSGIRNLLRHFVHSDNAVGLRLGIIHFLCCVISRLCAHQSKRILYTHLFIYDFTIYNLRFGCASKSCLTLPFAKDGAKVADSCQSASFLACLWCINGENCVFLCYSNLHKLCHAEETKNYYHAGMKNCSDVTTN